MFPDAANFRITNRAIAVLVTLAVIIAGGAFLLGQAGRDTEGDGPAAGLGLAADGVTATYRIQLATQRLAEGDLTNGVALSEASYETLSSLRTRARREGVGRDITLPLDLAARTSQEVAIIGLTLEYATRVSGGGSRETLRTVRGRLDESRQRLVRVSESLRNVRRLWERTIRTQITQLGGLASIDRPLRPEVAEASARARMGLSSQVKEELRQEINSRLTLVAERLDWLEPRPGPRTCGESQSGVEILVNSGSVSCREAFFVFRNSSGPNSSTAPTGWDCSGFAEALDGTAVGGADAYSCTHLDQATISFVAGSSTANQEVPRFTTPSENITCQIDSDGVRCDILEREFDPGPSPATCLNDFGNAVGVGTSGSGELLCVGDTVFVESAPVLGYGESSSVGDFICSVSESGVDCENRATGGGFSLSRRAIELR